MRRWYLLHPCGGLTSHLTLTRHSYQSGLAVINKEALDRMPYDLQKLLTGELVEETRKARTAVREAEPESLQHAASRGLKIHSSREVSFTRACRRSASTCSFGKILSSAR